MPWRFKPVTSKRLLYYGFGRQVLQSQNGGEQHFPSFVMFYYCRTVFVQILGSFSWSIACRMVGVEGVTHQL